MVSFRPPNREVWSSPGPDWRGADRMPSPRASSRVFMSTNMGADCSSVNTSLHNGRFLRTPPALELYDFVSEWLFPQARRRRTS
jgi:hypothetical protein